MLIIPYNKGKINEGKEEKAMYLMRIMAQKYAEYSHIGHTVGAGSWAYGNGLAKW